MLMMPNPVSSTPSSMKTQQRTNISDLVANNEVGPS